MRRSTLEPLHSSVSGTRPGYISFEEYCLDNGLRVILQEDHNSAVVCLNIAYHVGSKNEDVPRRGFAHLFEHLLFDGSAHVPRGKFDEYITQAGGHDNAYTTEDKTNYYEVLPSHQLELALWLESDRMLEFAASEIGLATQKQVVKEEKRERYDNTPYGSLSIRMNRLAYRTYPYWWDVIGDMDTIDAATLFDVRNFFERYYVPGNAVLVLAGDFDRDQALERIHRYFGAIPNLAPPLVQPPFDDPDILEERREIVASEPVPLPAVFYAFRAPPEGSREYLALDLLTDILSSGESSRLYQKLVYELQIASDVAAYVDGREMPGLLYLYAIRREPDGGTDALEAALDEVISEVILNGVTERELQKAKNKVEARTIVSRVTVQGRADQLAHAALFYSDAGRVNSILNEYGAVTLEEVRQAAKRYLNKSNRCAVLYLTSETTPDK